MSFNTTVAWLDAQRHAQLLFFAGDVTTVSGYLSGPAGTGEEGVPVGLYGRAVTLFVYDGTTTRSVSTDLVLSPTDRISMYADYDSGTFKVVTILNGSETALASSGNDCNTTLTATLVLDLSEVD